MSNDIDLDSVQKFAEDIISGQSENVWDQIGGGEKILEGIKPTESSTEKIIYTKGTGSIEFQRKKIIIRDSSRSRSWNSDDSRSDWEKGVSFLFEILGEKWIRYFKISRKNNDDRNRR